MPTIQVLQGIGTLLFQEDFLDGAGLMDVLPAELID